MILLLLTLTCPTPIILNTSKFPWNDYDKTILKQAEKRCGELYSDSPCVKVFNKYNERQYSVICGDKK